MKKNLQKVSKMCLLSIASIPLIMTLGNSMLIPVLPILEKKLHITSFQSSLFITSYSLASILLIPIAGLLSDKYGRKKIILPCLIIVIIGGLISGVAAWKMNQSYWTIIIGRLLQGVGAAGAAPIVLPLVGDLYPRDEDASGALGIIETSNTFGKVLSPILGAVFAAIIWFLPFYFISLLSLISFLLVLFFVKPSRKPKNMKLKAFVKNARSIFKIEGNWLFSLFLVGGFAMFILFALQVFLSNQLETVYHLHNIKKGLVLAIPLIFLCVASLVGGHLIKGNKQRMKKMILMGLVLQAISLLFFREDYSIFILLFLSSVIAVAIGFLLPTLDALITENIQKEQRGVITSFYSSARFIGVAIGPPIMSMFLTKALLIPAIFLATFSFMLVILVAKNIQVDEEC
ncbi:MULTISPECIES: MFS transporter [Bacillus]|uniref:MFS transporter n=1 Tax=Bacillus TaxID=1386 RepID=UPI000312FCFA|nr:MULTISPECIES: MFS transporter [Bacillus]